METIEAERTVTATTLDMFGATQLRAAPGRGAVAIYLASTVADSTGTVTVGGRSLKQSGLISKVIANAQIDINSDVPLMASVSGGEVILVDVTVVSPGTIRAKAVWMGEL